MHLLFACTQVCSTGIQRREGRNKRDRERESRKKNKRKEPRTPPNSTYEFRNHTAQWVCFGVPSFETFVRRPHPPGMKYEEDLQFGLGFFEKSWFETSYANRCTL